LFFFFFFVGYHLCLSRKDIKTTYKTNVVKNVAKEMSHSGQTRTTQQRILYPVGNENSGESAMQAKASYTAHVQGGRHPFCATPTGTAPAPSTTQSASAYRPRYGSHPADCVSGPSVHGA